MMRRPRLDPEIEVSMLWTIFVILAIVALVLFILGWRRH